MKYKQTWAGKEAAIDVYQGPIWKSLRAWLDLHPNWYHSRQQQATKFYVLSAKYGLIDAETRKIEPYDTLLGRDISPKDLERKLRSQVRVLEEKQAIPYAFVSRAYAKVLWASGLTFYYVKGGIGTKRKLLKRLLSSPGKNLPKKDVELYEANEYRLGNKLYNDLTSTYRTAAPTRSFVSTVGGLKNYKKLISQFEKEKLIKSFSYRGVKTVTGFERGENWRKLSKYKDLSDKTKKKRKK